MVRLIRLPLLVLAFAGVAARASAQDQLIAARGLYAAAAYEDALAVLNGLRAGAGLPQERPRIEEYRAFCLLALGRAEEADQAIEALILSEPSYRPSESEASPRVRTAFSNVRRRVLPGVIQQRYAAAKDAFDRKQHAAASDGFGQVLSLLADPDVASSATQSPLMDIRTLASGFRELAARAAAPPPPPVVPVPQPASVAEEPATPPVPRIYGTDEADVTPPVAVRQELPPFPQTPAGLGPAGGVLDIVIDESGTVESAVMRTSITPVYDRMVLAAVRHWRFRPATRKGIPVKFRKLTHITIKR
jgi:TonB family protein